MCEVNNKNVDERFSSPLSNRNNLYFQTFVKSRTAPYKYPRKIEFVTKLPKTVSGKIRRAALRQNEENLVTQNDASRKEI